MYHNSEKINVIYSVIELYTKKFLIGIDFILQIPECDEEYPCQGLGEHAHFKNFGMAFLTLFRVATGDNWNGIMKVHCLSSCHFRYKLCCIQSHISMCKAHNIIL